MKKMPEGTAQKLKEYWEKIKLAKENGEDISFLKGNPYKTWEKDKKSLRKAINAKCYDCVCGENYRNRIRYCNIDKCSLWNLRPYSKGITLEQCKNYIE